jgi:hypothetical protein
MLDANEAVTIKRSAAWEAGIDGLADHCRLDAAKVIDRALIEYNEGEGYHRKASQRSGATPWRPKSKCGR